MPKLLSASLKMIVRDRQAVFWALAFPVMFLGIFRLFAFDSPGTTSVVLAGEVQSEAGRALERALGDVAFIDLEVIANLDAAGAAEVIEDGDAAAVLLLHAAEGGTARAELIHGLHDPIASSATIGAIRSIVQDVNIGLIGVPPPVAVEARTVDVEEFSYFRFLGPGIIGMGMMSFTTIGLAASLSRYREEGVLRRVRATPLAPWRFFAGVVGAYVIVVAVQVVLLAIIAQALGASVLGNFPAFLVIALIGAVIFLNLGVIVAGKVKGRGASEGAANAITLPMMFLSGSFFPVDTLPGAVRPVVELLPLTHVLRALRSVSLDGEALWAQGPELAILGGWVLVTFVVARWAFRLDDA